MIRLKSINIRGFKDLNYEKKIVFSTESISVIYGENGSGKTTLLKILFAVLNKDSEILFQENVQQVNITYSKNKIEKNIIIKRDQNGDIDWGNNSELYNSNSILFGVHRGIIQEQKIILHIDKKNKLIEHLDELISYKGLTSVITSNLEKILHYKERIINGNRKIDYKNLYLKLVELKNEFNKNDILDSFTVHNDMDKHYAAMIFDKISRVIKEIEYFLLSKKEKNDFLEQIDNQTHLSIDSVKIEDIKDVIINQYIKGQSIISEKIKNAFIETIEKAIEIDEKDEDFLLPDNFAARIESNKDFILKAIPKENSFLAKKIKKFLKIKDKSHIEKSKIFRSMLLNIVKSAEEANPTLESINKLVEIFNEHLYDGKKLIVNEKNVYIELKNKSFHELHELSSGERNLLSILTLFLIIGNKRNFLIIDEPEISLNLKWQRDFLPLLSRINSKAQIIVASHSPSIAHNNSNYLIELK